MKRLDRHVLWSFCLAYGSAAVVFMGLYVLVHFTSQMGRVREASEHLAQAGIPAFVGYSRYYTLNLPFMFVETTPFTVLVGAMWTMQQMARRGEIVPVLTSGVSLQRLAAPVLLAAVGLGLATNAIRELALPSLALERYQLERLIRGQKLTIFSELPLMRDGEGRLFHVAGYDLATRSALGVEMQFRKGEIVTTRRAERLRWLAPGPDGPGWYEKTGTGWRRWPTDLSYRDIEVQSRYLTYVRQHELERMMLRMPNRPLLEVQWHLYHVSWLHGFALALVGLPLVFGRQGQGGGPVAIALAMMLGVAFFATQKILADAGARGAIPPALAAWGPLVLFGGPGFLSFWRRV